MLVVSEFFGVHIGFHAFHAISAWRTPLVDVFAVLQNERVAFVERTFVQMYLNYPNLLFALNHEQSLRRLWKIGYNVKAGLHAAHQISSQYTQKFKVIQRPLRRHIKQAKLPNATGVFKIRMK